MNLTPQNDAPVNRINGTPISGTPARTGREDTAFVFNAANSSVVSVADDTGASTNNEFRLDVTNGTVTLPTTSGLTPILGTNGSALMSFSGSLANINAALNGMTFNPTPNFNGHATVTIFYDDNGNTGGGDLTDTDTIDIDVRVIVATNKNLKEFVLFTNLPGQPHFSYIRHLENTLRSPFGFDGVPIRVMIKGRPR